MHAHSRVRERVSRVRNSSERILKYLDVYDADGHREACITATNAGAVAKGGGGGREVERLCQFGAEP